MEAVSKMSVQKKVLVVEDDDLLRKLLVRKLSNEGFSVRESFNVTGAFSMLDQEKPDIILLDLILPGVDGFGIIEKIKTDGRFDDVPVLILSNLGQEEDVKRVMELGAYDFLVKADHTLYEIVDKVKSVFLELDK